MLGSIKTKLSPLIRLKVKLKVKVVSSQLSNFWAIHLCMYSILPSIGHFHHFHFLKTIHNHNLEQEQFKPCPENVEDFPAVLFHSSHWYLLWKWQIQVIRGSWVGRSTSQSKSWILGMLFISNSPNGIGTNKGQQLDKMGFLPEIRITELDH